MNIACQRYASGEDRYNTPIKLLENIYDFMSKTEWGKARKGQQLGALSVRNCTCTLAARTAVGHRQWCVHLEVGLLTPLSSYRCGVTSAIMPAILARQPDEEEGAVVAAWGTKVGYASASVERMRGLAALPLLGLAATPLLAKDLSAESLPKVRFCWDVFWPA